MIKFKMLKIILRDLNQTATKHLYFNFMCKCLWVSFHHFLQSCSKINTFVMKSEMKENKKKFTKLSDNYNK